MKTSLSSFISGLSDLRHYINGLEIEAQILSSAISCKRLSVCKTNVINFNEHWSKSYIRKKRFNYNSIIVSLYGYFEQYIEGLINRVANSLNDIVPSYKQLHPHIQAHHLRLSLDLIKRAEHARYREKVTIDKVIENLNRCINEDAPYRLNYEAFAQHSANFKLEIINEIFKFVGIENACERILSKQVFRDYLKQIYPERETSSIKSEDAFFYLQDLAERRNQVAHGVLPDELLSNDILQSYLIFFEAFGKGLYQVCQSDVLPYVVKYRAIPLGTPSDVLIGGSVVCLYINDVKIKVGDEIIARSGDGKNFYSGAIEEIQIEDVSHGEVLVSTRVEVGLRLPFKCKKTYDFFLSNTSIRPDN
jgi:hypothetical protein